MNRDKQIEYIKEKCLKANPDIMQYRKGAKGMHVYVGNRPIRLSDILIAIKGSILHETSDFRLRSDGTADFRILGIAVDTPQGWFGWNLLKDNLTLQEDPTIDFLYTLLKGDNE